MAEFCEGCPLAGDATGELEKVEFIDVARIARMLFGPEYGDSQISAVVRDENQNPSRPITIGEVSEEDILRRIEQCHSVAETVEKRLFRKPQTKPYCPGLGRLAVPRNSEVYNYVADRVMMDNR